MSELGNKIRRIRGTVSQAEFADRAGLSLRTISKLEAGDSVRLDTVRRIAATCDLSDADRLELVISWIKLEIGDDYFKMIVEPKAAAAVVKDSESLVGKIQRRLQDVPSKYQEQIYLMLERPEILRCLEHLNDLYQSIRNADSKGA
jgi:transcriptional regulator with XRE-family HTH domain